ncbi:hypothetical protein [Rossellomorea aquimaris]|uniref:hypothetical protein n=1 Tax=Rossellomorea aquimaris TaxID=189382 RepID=UPI0007D04561|nr:hypothetical protein [Rossellomorea aquimaris]
MAKWKKKRIKVELPPDEYEKAHHYIKKLKEADSIIELNYYYKKVAKIIENSQDIEDDSIRRNPSSNA